MKKLAFFVFFSLITLGAFSQAQVKWNVNAGIGMASWYGDDSDGTDAKFAYKIGVGMEVPFNQVWSFQSGLNFISKGVSGDEVTDGWDVVDVSINQLYLELPLMVGARIHTASNFDLLFKAGPYLAYGVGGKIKAEAGNESGKADTFGDDGLKRFDAGLGLGVAFEFDKIVLGVETNTGLTKLMGGLDAQNISAMLTVGYKF